MTFNAMTEHYEEITVCGKPALFTSIRIKRDTIPDGLYAYDVRHDDECRGIPCEIAPFVMWVFSCYHPTDFRWDSCIIYSCTALLGIFQDRPILMAFIFPDFKSL